jgi:hypothetical protein
VLGDGAVNPLVIIALAGWVVFVPIESDARLAAIAAVDPDRAALLAGCRERFVTLGHAMFDNQNRVEPPCFAEAVKAGVLAVRWSP